MICINSLQAVVMDGMKMDPKVDPLAVQTSDNRNEHKGHLSQDGNLLNVDLSRVKTECVDHSYDVTSEMEFEETPAPFTFAVVKCEAVEDPFSMIAVKDELKQEVILEEDQILSERIAVTHDSRMPLQYDRIIEDHMITEKSSKNSDSSEEAGCESSSDCHYPGRQEDNVEAQSCSLKPDHSVQSSAEDSSTQKCNICNKILASSLSLERHLKIHSEERPFKCDDCGKSFTLMKNLRKHMRMHTGEFLFECEECGKCFPQSSELKRHARQHTGEKPFKCDVCGKCFSRSDRVKVHARQHTGEKPFTCTECGKSFSDSRYLRVHERHHRGEKEFKCNECGRCFSQSGKLKIHSRLHTGEKPFKCSDCGKCFSDSSYLKIHVRQHTGEKPFKCDVCGKGFTVSSNLKIHLRVHKN
ncbi:zinc finger protein 664-like isoform X1 [Periplaneta americana]|uniref:zinc finger protein 664-like isoform X1 n=2 Tax=Periplaneta americana TaxID=6978 RepID=UPI0037E731C6